MDEFSRRALVASTAPATDGGIVETTGSLLVGIFVGGLMAGVIAYVVGAVATLVALVATTCPRPYLAWITCLVLAPPWMSVLSTLDLDVPGFMVLCGLLPGAVRLGFGDRVPSTRAGDVADSAG